MNLYAIIMAGGVGTRFWPRSKEKTPKQLLKIFNSKTMIQNTVERLDGLVKNENIYVITNKIQKDEIINQLTNVPEKNILIEPFGKNTAACIGLASIYIEHLDLDAVTFVLPADHIIKEKEEFHKTLKRAAEYAYKNKGLVTIGVQPTRPETGYGYIQIDEREVEEDIFNVYTFAEKPNYATAVRFLESGDFFWNSGMFIWRVDSILSEIKEYLPELHEGMAKLKDNFGKDNYLELLENIYGKLRSVSIDYGIMEKSKKVFLTKGKFTWSDVGSWEEVYQLSNKDEHGNASTGKVFTDMTMDSYIYSPDKFTAMIGVDNLIVINTKDSLLICRRDRSQDVKKIVEHLKVNKLNDFI